MITPEEKKLHFESCSACYQTGRSEYVTDDFIVRQVLSSLHMEYEQIESYIMLRGINGALMN